MADYYRLMARAVASLPQNTEAARRALYERARNALVTQLRGQTPTLSDSSLAAEQASLEDAIRRVEAESAPRSSITAFTNTVAIATSAGQRKLEAKKAGGKPAFWRRLLGRSGPGEKFSDPGLVVEEMTRRTTNPLEVAAYIITELAIFFSHLDRSQFSLDTYAAEHLSAMLPLYFGYGAMWSCLTFALLLVTRGLLGGTPMAISGPHRRRAITSRRSELIAYAIAQLIGVTVIIKLRATMQLLLLLDGTAFDALFNWNNIGVANVIFILFLYLRRALMSAAYRGVKAQTRTADSIPKVEQPELAGIAGWLILPAIGLTLGTVINFASLIYALYPGNDKFEFSRGVPAAIDVMEFMSSVGIIIFSIFAAIEFFGKSRWAPSIFISLTVWNAFAIALLMIIEVRAGMTSFVTANVPRLAVGLIAAAIWIPYFVLSKRVKATFVN